MGNEKKTYLAFHAERAFLHPGSLDVELLRCQSLYSLNKKQAEFTLGVFVNPLNGHSLTSGGVPIEVVFAWATQGSLMILTTYCFVAW